MDRQAQQRIVVNYFSAARMEAERAHLQHLRKQVQEVEVQVVELTELLLVLANIVRQPDPGSAALCALHEHREASDRLDRMNAKRAKLLQDLIEVEARVTRWRQLQIWGGAR